MKSIKFNSVTWYSKLLAVLIFLGVIPALAFCFGRMYERVENIYSENTNMYSGFSKAEVIHGAVSTNSQLSTADCKKFLLTNALSENTTHTSTRITIPLSCEFNIGKDNKKISIQINQKNEDTATLAISFFSNSTNSLKVQQIDFRNFVDTFSQDTTEHATKYTLNSSAINLSTDYNFDGYTDLVVLHERGASNVFYDFLFFNPKTNLFERNALLTNISNPTFDPSKKTITAGVLRGVNSISVTLYAFNPTTGKYFLIEAKDR